MPLVLSVVIAIPLAQLARHEPQAPGASSSVPGPRCSTRFPRWRLFVILPAILGTRILDIANIIVALTIYAVALLVRSTAGCP